MKSESTFVQIEHNPGEPLPDTGTDWARVDAFTEEELHANALSDPDNQPIPFGTDEELAKLGLHRLVNVKKLREKLGLTQEEFAATYRIPVGTLRDWEQCRKNPDAPARAYLIVISRNPEMVAEWLRRAA